MAHRDPMLIQIIGKTKMKLDMLQRESITDKHGRGSAISEALQRVTGTPSTLDSI
jgi:hypothetical protein